MEAPRKPEGPVWGVALAARDQELSTNHGTAMDGERQKILAGLALWRQVRDGDPFWATMDKAETDGHLDAAIFLLLMNPSLYDEFIVWREQHLEELLTYTGGYLEVIPSFRVK